MKYRILTDRHDDPRICEDAYLGGLTIGLVGDRDFLLPAKLAGHVHSHRRSPLVDHWDIWRDVLTGYSLNNLTLMALTISTGFVVDDAIVMIRISTASGGRRFALDAALKVGQIGFHHCLAYGFTDWGADSLLFMGTLSDGLFREFAVTLAVPFGSAAVSLKLTPMMCAKLLKHRKEGERPLSMGDGDYYNRVIGVFTADREMGAEAQTLLCW